MSKGRYGYCQRQRVAGCGAPHQRKLVRVIIGHTYKVWICTECAARLAGDEARKPRPRPRWPPVVETKEGR